MSKNYPTRRSFIGLAAATVMLTSPLAALADELAPADEQLGMMEGEEPLESAADEAEESLDANSGGTVNVYRLYNWRTSEHLYTTSRNEYEDLPFKTGGDWIQEGVAWVAPKKSSTPVYRLYNSKSGDHHYTTSRGERDSLVAKSSWKYEQVAFYSDDSRRVPLYRVYNGKLRRGQHHYTTSRGERNSLVSKSGWRDEGVGFYAVKKGSPMAPKTTIPTGTFYLSYMEDLAINLHSDGTCCLLVPVYDKANCRRVTTALFGTVERGREVGARSDYDSRGVCLGRNVRKSASNIFAVRLSDGSYFGFNFWIDPMSGILYRLDPYFGFIDYVGDPFSQIPDIDFHSSKDYILPESSSRYYTKNEIDGFGILELWIARNEIYARHGRKFSNAWLQDYFNMQSWYVGTYAPSQYDVGGKPRVFNDYERANRDLIEQCEEGDYVFT